MPQTTVTVLYPKTSSSTFNLDYYLSSHMPLVKARFTQYGLQGYKVAKVAGDDNQYSIVCTLDFETQEQVQKAFGGEHVNEVLGDVKNFSNVDPLLLIGDVVGTDQGAGGQAKM